MTIEEAIGALRRYQDHQLDPGGFLRAVLSNDLVEAVNRGDAESLQSLPAITRHVYSNLPSNIWGSKERVQNYFGKQTK
jgi:hypothetical protein